MYQDNDLICNLLVLRTDQMPWEAFPADSFVSHFNDISVASMKCHRNHT